MLPHFGWFACRVIRNACPQHIRAYKMYLYLIFHIFLKFQKSEVVVKKKQNFYVNFVLFFNLKNIQEICENNEYFERVRTMGNGLY